MSLRVKITINAVAGEHSRTETRTFQAAIPTGTIGYYTEHLAGLAQEAIQDCLEKLFAEGD